MTDVEQKVADENQVAATSPAPDAAPEPAPVNITGTISGIPEDAKQTEEEKTEAA